MLIYCCFIPYFLSLIYLKWWLMRMSCHDRDDCKNLNSSYRPPYNMCHHWPTGLILTFLTEVSRESGPVCVGLICMSLVCIVNENCGLWERLNTLVISHLWDQVTLRLWTSPLCFIFSSNAPTQNNTRVFFFLQALMGSTLVCGTCGYCCPKDRSTHTLMEVMFLRLLSVHQTVTCDIHTILRKLSLSLSLFFTDTHTKIKYTHTQR